MRGSRGPKKTWRYSEEFKVKAVQMSEQEGIQVQQVATGLGIHPFMLSRWRKAYRDGTLKVSGNRRVGVMKESKPPSKREVSELAELRRENARLKQENELLKKWQRYLAERHQSDLDSSKSTEER